MILNVCFRILSFLTAQKGRKNAPPERPFFRIVCSPVLEIRQQAAQRAPSAALPGIARHCDVQGVRLPSRFARALHLSLFALPDPCIPAMLPDHSLSVSVPSGLASQASHSPDGLRGGNGLLLSLPRVLSQPGCANCQAAEKPRRAVVCGPQFQASGRLKRTALRVASQPLLASQKWQKKLINRVRAMSSDAVCAEPFPPFQHDMWVGADNLPLRGCETSVCRVMILFHFPCTRKLIS
ncbi:hypothetical protein Selin_1252 [Desulfurispirillum indicum S5]|uniref:Uncharacterized protein n=1 Tax=Desulfurispirillum indicum (strain ATCC BAA-1389 / DSM 22839 / S5) TaxID=653733 RepID=E6W511_DESIS|nr:hypothetical protein Selin_1252 [Desulfurispirillum indicum S5]